MEQAPVAWYDVPLDTRERKILTGQNCPVPGLRMFGFHNTAHALVPLPPHYHKNCFEFSYLVQGNLCFGTEKDVRQLSGGQWYITFPDEIHSSGGQPLSIHKMYWFQLDVSDPGHFLYLQKPVAEALIGRLSRLQERVIRENSEAVLSRIWSALCPETESGCLQAGCLLAALLCRLTECAGPEPSPITPDIQQSLAYIDAHLREDISMESLAGIALLSVSRFKQKFKNQMGTGPRNYINYHKVELAKQLLQKGLGVTDAAMELGFSNSNYFSTVFRRYTSLSPTDFRAAALKK